MAKEGLPIDRKEVAPVSTLVFIECTQALLHAHDLDLEWEARASVAIGSLYTKVLKMADRGVQDYTTAISLGMALRPRVVRTLPAHAEDSTDCHSLDWAVPSELTTVVAFHGP